MLTIASILIPLDSLAFVFAKREDTGSVRVCCEHGIITHDGKKDEHWVPVDKYTVVAKPNESVAISLELQKVRQLVLTGKYKDKGKGVVT